MISLWVKHDDNLSAANYKFESCCEYTVTLTYRWIKSGREYIMDMIHWFDNSILDHILIYNHINILLDWIISRLVNHKSRDLEVSHNWPQQHIVYIWSNLHFNELDNQVVSKW